MNLCQKEICCDCLVDSLMDLLPDVERVSLAQVVKHRLYWDKKKHLRQAGRFPLGGSNVF